jgi:CBS domain containing-hemolysin-like protein
MEYLLEGLTLLGLLALSAFFSGSETAIFHLPRVTVEKLAARFPIIKEREKLLASILLGNTFVNAGASIIAARIFYRLFDSGAQAITTGVMTYLILVFGEFSPKLYSLRNAERISSKTLPVLNLIRYLFLPITVPINVLMGIVRSDAQSRAPVTREELRTLTDYEAEEGDITQTERLFILRLLSFKSRTVGDIMTSADKVEALPASTELENDEMPEFSHSRIPVYRGDLDNIIGVLYLKDLLLTEENTCKIRKIVRKPHFVTESMSAPDLLSYFQTKRVHIAIVVDEDEITKGVVTLDDILNTVVGNTNLRTV